MERYLLLSCYCHEGQEFLFLYGRFIEITLHSTKSKSVSETQLSKKTENFMSKNKLFCKIN